MRILHVIPFFTPKMGGSAVVAFQMARHLAERGHEVTVVTSDHSLSDTRFDTESFETIYLPCMARWGFYFTPGLVSWARSNVRRFDLVHMHTLRTFQNAVVGYYARKNNIPYVISAHGTLPVIVERKTAKRMYDRLAGQRLLNGAACLVAVSPFEAGQYESDGIEEERIQIIYNGLDLEEFKDLPPRGTFRQRLGIPAETPIILFLGRLHRRKGIDHLIQAFAQSRCQLNGAKLLIAGPDDGGEEHALRDLVAQLGLNGSVLFTGPLYGQEKLAAFVDADVLASPAVHEIFGLVPFEALMCGTPVVVTDDCGSGQIIGQAKVGYVVPYGDIKSLETALVHMLLQQSEALDRTKVGQTFVRDSLNQETIINELEAIYLELAASRLTGRLSFGRAKVN